MTNTKKTKTKDIDAHCNGHQTYERKHSSKNDNKNQAKQSYYYLHLFLSTTAVCLLIAILLAFYNGTNNVDQSLDTIPSSSKTPNTIPSPTTTKSLKHSEQESSIHTNATLLVEKMITFLDELVELQLDDFVTVENTPGTRLSEILRFNNLQILPRLSSIVKMDLFKFVKFNLQRPCTLWHDSFSCTKMFVFTFTTYQFI